MRYATLQHSRASDGGSPPHTPGLGSGSRSTSPWSGMALPGRTASNSGTLNAPASPVRRAVDHALGDETADRRGATAAPLTPSAAAMAPPRWQTGPVNGRRAEHSPAPWESTSVEPDAERQSRIERIDDERSGEGLTSSSVIGFAGAAFQTSSPYSWQQPGLAARIPSRHGPARQRSARHARATLA